jgi:hypothetical protein
MQTKMCSFYCFSAGLGGAVCGVQCLPHASDNEVAQTQEALFGDSKTIICNELCTNGLGELLYEILNFHFFKYFLSYSRKGVQL